MRASLCLAKQSIAQGQLPYNNRFHRSRGPRGFRMDGWFAAARLTVALGALTTRNYLTFRRQC